MTNINFSIPISLGLLGLVSIASSKIIELSSGEKLHPIAWIASGFIVISSLVVRYRNVVDTEKFNLVIQETNPTEYPLDPQRYINWITIAMVVGLIATITIHYNFIVGMLVYLLMQLSLIRAFSGIFIINPKLSFTHPKLKNVSRISALFWTAYVIFVYTFFVYNGSESLIVVPYVICLGYMAHLTWYGFSYDRTPLFKYMLVLASAVFVFSDSLIGNDVYGERKVNENLYHTIDMTYVLNIFLMAHAVLFLMDKSGSSILHSESLIRLKNKTN